MFALRYLEMLVLKNKDLSNFLDFDECLNHLHGCQHNCNNYKGGYFCSCRAGYRLKGDNKTCTGMFLNIRLYCDLLHFSFYDPHLSISRMSI